MLNTKNINWDDLPDHLRRGAYVKKIKTKAKLGPEIIQKLPDSHPAKADPDYEFERTQIAVLDLPYLTSIHNRYGVLSKGEKPIT